MASYLGFPYYQQPFGVTNTGPAVMGNLPEYADNTGLVITDSGVSPSTLIGGPFLRLDGTSTMTGTINSLSVIPTVDNSSDIGSSSKRLRTMYGYVLTGPTNSRNIDDIVSNIGTSTSGNLASLSGTTGKIITDSGTLATNVVTNTSTGATGNLPSFVSAKVIGDSSIVASNVVTNTSTGATGNLPSFVSAKVIGDSGKIAADVVTGPASAAAGNIASFTSSKVIQDSGVPSSALSGAPFLPLAGGVMAGDIDINNHVIGNVLAGNIRMGYTTTASYTDSVIIGNFAGSSGVGVVIAIGPNSTGANTAISIGSGVTAGSGSTVIGEGSVDLGTINTLYGRGQNTAAANTGVVSFGDINTATVSNAMMFGDHLTNSTANSLLLGNSSLVNIRTPSTVCDLATAAVPFQTLYVQKVVASSAYCFSGYAAGGFSVGFTANTPKLVVTTTLTELNDPQSVFTPTASTGEVKYTGATTRYFNVRILFNILGNASANTYTAWVAKGGSTTQVAARNFNFTTATPVGYLPFEVSNIYQLAQNDVVQLAAQYTATANVNIFDIQVIITPMT